MSAFTDLLHTLVDKLPFHSQAQAEDAHNLVEAAESEFKDSVAAVKNFVVGSGVKSTEETQQPQGIDQNATDNNPPEDAK